VSDLADLKGAELPEIRKFFGLLVTRIEEFYDPSRTIVLAPVFEDLGLTDAAIAMVCSRGILVLTADLPLQLALQHRGVDALNFNHLRPIGWNQN
jgi:uncharacterized protein YaiI (UPF0178 family)